MTKQPAHHHLLFPSPAGRVPAYANLFRFGAADGPAPLITYIGGTVGRKVYLERSAPAPEHPVMLEFSKALASARSWFPAVDLLVCPCPMDTGGEGLDGFLDHFDGELLEAVPAKPLGFGFVGYSAGAGYATHLAIATEARGLAVFGGVGVAAAAQQLRTTLEKAAEEGWRLNMALFRNSGDQTAEPAAVAGALTLCEASPRPPGAGDHKFSSYAANGTVQAAFRYVLDRLDPDAG